MPARKKGPQDQIRPGVEPLEELSFEQAVQQLQQMVERMEDEQLGLEEAVACYEQGVALLRHCMTLLRKAEQRIVLLTGVDEEGNPIVEPLMALEPSTEQLAPGRQRPLRSGNSEQVDT